MEPVSRTGFFYGSDTESNVTLKVTRVGRFSLYVTVTSAVKQTVRASLSGHMWLRVRIFLCCTAPSDRLTDGVFSNLGSKTNYLMTTASGKNACRDALNVNSGPIPLFK